MEWRNIMTKWILSVILSLSIIAISNAAIAGPKPKMKPDGPPPGGDGETRVELRVRMHGDGGPMFFGDPEDMKAKLGLTDEQVDKIGKVNDEYRKRLLKVREDIEPKISKLHSLLEEENINLKDIRSLLEEIARLEVEIRMLRINQALDIAKILTPDQRKQLRNSMRRMMGNLYRPEQGFLYKNERISID
jgi:Spy/CpxP family protein refolding chaperone